MARQSVWVAALGLVVIALMIARMEGTETTPRTTETVSSTGEQQTEQVENDDVEAKPAPQDQQTIDSLADPATERTEALTGGFPCPPPLGISDDFCEGFERKRQMRLALEREAFDPNWSPVMERQLRETVDGFVQTRPQLSERFAVTRIRCKTTVCEVQLFDYGSSEFQNEIDGLRKLFVEIEMQAWAAQIDRRDTHMIGSMLDGVLEYRVYFKRLPVVVPGVLLLESSRSRP